MLPSQNQDRMLKTLSQKKRFTYQLTTAHDTHTLIKTHTAHRRKAVTSYGPSLTKSHEKVPQRFRRRVKGPLRRRRKTLKRKKEGGR